MTAFSRVGLGHARQVRARRDALSDLDRHQLEDAGEPGADLELMDLVAPQARHRPALVHARALHGELRLHSFRVLLQPLLLDPVPIVELIGRELRELPREVGDQALLGELGVGLRAQLGLVEFGLDAGGHRLLIEVAALEVDLGLDVLGLGLAELRLGVERGLLDLRVAQLEDHAVRRHVGAGEDDDPLHASFGDGGDPAGVLRHERAEAAHVDDERAPLHGVQEDGRALDFGRRRLKARQAEGNQEDGGGGSGTVTDAAALARDCDRSRACDIHRAPLAPKAVPGRHASASGWCSMT